MRRLSFKDRDTLLRPVFLHGNDRSLEAAGFHCGVKDAAAAAPRGRRPLSVGTRGAELPGSAPRRARPLCLNL